MHEADFFRLIKQDDAKTEVILPGYVQRCRCLNKINWQNNKTEAGLNPRAFLGYEARKIEVRLELLGETDEEINENMARVYEIYRERGTDGKPWVYEPRFPDLVAQRVSRIVFENLEPVYVSGEPTVRQVSLKFLEEDSEPAVTKAMAETVQVAKPLEAESGKKYEPGTLRDSKFKGMSFLSVTQAALGAANEAADKISQKEFELDDPEP